MTVSSLHFTLSRRHNKGDGRRRVRQSKASGQSATLLQDPGAAGAAERCEIESRLDDGRAQHFDAFEIARSAAGIFGEAQGVVADRKSTRLNSSHLGISYA